MTLAKGAGRNANQTPRPAARFLDHQTENPRTAEVWPNYMQTTIPVCEMSPECRERQLCTESRRSMLAINAQLLAENRAKRLRDWKLMLLGALWAAVVLSLALCAAFYFSK